MIFQPAKKKKKNDPRKKSNRQPELWPRKLRFLQCLQNFLNALQNFLQALQISATPKGASKHAGLWPAQAPSRSPDAHQEPARRHKKSRNSSLKINNLFRLCGEGGSRTYAFRKYHKIANH